MRVAMKGGQPTDPVVAPAVPVLVDTLFAPEILATGFAGVANLGGVIVVTLERARCDHTREPPPIESVVVGRIAMTQGAAQDLVAGLNHVLQQQGQSRTGTAAIVTRA